MTTVAAPRTPEARTSSGARVVHLAPGHVPFDTRVFHKEAQSLAQAGYEVVVIAPHDREEWVDGVRIVPLPRHRGRIDRFVFGPIRLFRCARRARGDVYHLHDIEALPVGMALARRGRAVIWDSHEDYPRLALDRPWIPRPLRWLVARLVAQCERLAVRSMRAVVSAEDEGARRFPAEKTVVVRNSPLRREFATPGPSLASRSSVLAYVGVITRQRGAVEMVDLVGRLDPALGARLVLVGRFGEPDLEAELRAMPGWARVDYRGEQDRTGVQAALNEAVAGLVLWHPTRKHAEGAMPVKLLEYMAAGLPVIASDLPLLHEVVTGADAGVLIDPFDIDAAAQVATRLLQDRASAIAFGTRGRDDVLANRTWSREEPTLLSLYEDVLAGSVVSPA